MRYSLEDSATWPTMKQALRGHASAAGADAAAGVVESGMRARWFVAALMCLGIIACNRSDTASWAAQAARVGLSQAEADVLRAAALGAARAEAYDVARANLMLIRKGEHYEALFIQRAKDAVGGELHVVMDRTGRIVRIYDGL